MLIAAMEANVVGPEPQRGQHWLYDWMDEYEVYDADTVRDRLDSLSAIERLGELAAENRKATEPTIPLAGSVVAGPGIEISGPAVCHRFTCRRKTVDSDFGSLLQYFDQIVMEGPSANRYVFIADALRHKERRMATQVLIDDVETLQYFRDIRLDNHILYSSKPNCFCDNHFKKFAASLGLDEYADEERLQEIAAELRRAGAVSIKEGREEWYCRLAEPFYHGSVGMVYKSKPSQEKVAYDIIRRDLMNIVFDSAVAQKKNIPLVSLAEPQVFNPKKSNAEVTVDDVATRLNIPILSALTTGQIIQLREREPQHFETFRAALREAIITTIGESPNRPPGQIGQIVWRDHLKPALADLENRVSANTKATIVQSSMGLTIGTAATAVTAMAAAPWAAAILGTAVASTLPLTQISGYIKERKQNELAGMYFLWKAKKIQDHN